MRSRQNLCSEAENRLVRCGVVLRERAGSTPELEYHGHSARSIARFPIKDDVPQAPAGTVFKFVCNILLVGQLHKCDIASNRIRPATEVSIDIIRLVACWFYAEDRTLFEL